MDNFIRKILWTSVPFNLGAATLLAFPAIPPAQLVGLPADVPAVYRAMLGLFVALFGLMYGWLALQPVIHRPLIGFSTIGKGGVFVTVAILSLMDLASPRLLIPASGDLAFGCCFAWYLMKKS